MIKKVLILIIFSTLISSCGTQQSGLSLFGFGKQPTSINHVVLIWLKRPGNLQAQQMVIQETLRFSDYPGLLSLNIGRAIPSSNRVVDDSFDVAMTMRFANKTSLDRYLQDPYRSESLRNVIMPAVRKILVYDFFDQSSVSSNAYQPQQAPGGYQQTPGGYQQAPSRYPQQAPGGYQQPQPQRDPNIRYY